MGETVNLHRFRKQKARAEDAARAAANRARFGAPKPERAQREAEAARAAHAHDAHKIERERKE